MLTFALVAFVISVIAGALGFTGVAKAGSAVAKVVFGVFLAVAVLLLALFALGIKLIT